MAGKWRTGYAEGFFLRRLRGVEGSRGDEEEAEKESERCHRQISDCEGEREKYGYRCEGLWAQCPSRHPETLSLSSKSQDISTLKISTRSGKISLPWSAEQSWIPQNYPCSGSSSLPAAASISEPATQRRKREVVTHSSSPLATRRGYRKIRRGYPATTKAPPSLRRSDASCSSSRRSSGVARKATPDDRVPDLTRHTISLPLVGQRSRDVVSQQGKILCKQDRLRMIGSPSMTSCKCDDDDISRTRVDRTVRQKHQLMNKPLTVARYRVDEVRKWGCGSVRGWKSACEDTSEELEPISRDDSISIEESSVADTEETEANGEHVGFSDEDLTDLENSETTSTENLTRELPIPPDSDLPWDRDIDLPTYSLLEKASQRLELLSVASDSEDSDNSSAGWPRRRGSGYSSAGWAQVRGPLTTKQRECSRPKQTEQRATEMDQTKPKSDQRQIEEVDTFCVQDNAQEVKEERVCLVPSSPLTPSLFPGLESTIHFPTPSEPYTPLPAALRSQLKWKMSSITPNVIKNCIARVGFTPSTKGGGWLGYWGKHMQSQAFRSVAEHQKVNHFPGSFEIGRKDRLWRNLCRLQSRVGRKNLDFIPLTFVLPHDLRLLKREWESENKRKRKWILKPPAAARGIGVRVVHKWNQIPKKRPIIVQKYIADPFLIRGSKIDLRVYVYVSSYDPLMVYVFPDGLTRFATCKYSSSSQSLSNRFIHLTNYSVNKKNSQFSQNPDETVCQGHKWGLLALWRYMSSELGIDSEAVWQSVVEVVIKTIICSEAHCSTLVKAHVQNSYSCHELFGFDVVLDRKLKPWLIEVNISPSLHSNSKLDLNIKGQLARDLLNIAGFHLPPKHAYRGGLTAEERQKHSYFLQKGLPEHERIRILDNLTPSDIAVLMCAEDEFARRGMYQRVFPTHESGKYRKFFESEKYNNILLEQWLLKYRHCPDRGIQLLQSLATTTNTRDS